MVAQEIESFADLGNVLFNQVFGANPGMGVQRRITHIAKIVMQTLTQRTLQAFKIILLTILFDTAQAIIKQLIIVKLRREILFPLGIAFQKIQFQRCGLPHLVVGRLGKHLAEFVNPWIFKHAEFPSTGGQDQKSSSIRSSSLPLANGSRVTLPSLIRYSLRCRKALRTKI